MKIYGLVFSFLIALSVKSQKPVKLPVPTRQQLAWHSMEYYLFMHFGPNTFTDKERGDGAEPEDLFNPGQLDCRQWCNAAKAAGAKGIIITAKHHDGFCLWPSKYSKHTVRESKWKDGKGDVLKELSQACREAGLKFGVYISPWDRNHPDYGTPKYNDVFVNMVKEVLQNYGAVWELWWDRYNAEGPNGKKQVYDWRRFENTVRQISPKTVVFSDTGPDIRWVGNEDGIAAETNWNYVDTTSFKSGLVASSNDPLSQDNVSAIRWIPVECDVSIRPGWFYHSNEDVKIKTPKQLFDLYLKSVGRGASLLLNIPPDRRGLISEVDVGTLMEFKRLRDESFSGNLLKDASTYYEFSRKDLSSKELNFRSFDATSSAYGINLQNFIVQLKEPARINCIVLKEAIHLGQTVKKFRIQLYDNTKMVKEIQGTTVGNKRILTFPALTISSFKVYLDDARGTDNISGVAAYLIDETLVNSP